MPLFQTLTKTPPYLLYMMDMEVSIFSRIIGVHTCTSIRHVSCTYYGETRKIIPSHYVIVRYRIQGIYAI